MGGVLDVVLDWARGGLVGIEWLCHWVARAGRGVWRLHWGCVVGLWLFCGVRGEARGSALRDVWRREARLLAGCVKGRSVRRCKWGAG